MPAPTRSRTLLPLILALTLAVPPDGAPVPYPAIRNMGIREATLFAGILAPGDVLTIQPVVPDDILRRFDSYDLIAHHGWLLRAPNGTATLTAADGSVRDVSRQVYFPSGYTYADADAPRPDDTRFALDGAEEPRFAHSGTGDTVRAPRLRLREDDWIFELFPPDKVRSITGAEMPGSEDNGSGNGEATAPRIDLTVTWWRRPPACFRLRIRKTAWVREAERRGAVDLIRQSLDRARAAGVEALLDFPEPVLTEGHALAERAQVTAAGRWTEAQPLGESVPAVAAADRRVEDLALTDGPFSMLGILDTTRLDWMHLG